MPCVITSQKFAKGSRFGPLLAKKSYIPIENLRFPLIIFGNIIPDLNIPELEELFKVRNVYLDTTNENECNWMVHVNPAEYLNEQNLIAYQVHVKSCEFSYYVLSVQNLNEISTSRRIIKYTSQPYMTLKSGTF